MDRVLEQREHQRKSSIRKGKPPPKNMYKLPSTKEMEKDEKERVIFQQLEDIKKKADSNYTEKELRYSKSMAEELLSIKHIK